MKWTDLIKPEIKEKMLALAERAQSEREAGKTVCPPQDQIFRGLELTSPENVKVVIVGQDPYHTPGQANGLAFSVSSDTPVQPSLRNIFKEYHDDLGFPQPSTGDLTPWAEQGVLLLNTSLTVEAHKPNSHSSWGWQTFTGEIIRICSQLPQPIVFLAWGRNAQDLIHSYLPIADQRWLMRNWIKACIESSHPSPFSASKPSNGSPAFLGSKPFSLANKCLIEMKAEPINWRLP